MFVYQVLMANIRQTELVQLVVAVVCFAAEIKMFVHHVLVAINCLV